MPSTRGKRPAGKSAGAASRSRRVRSVPRAPRAGKPAPEAATGTAARERGGPIVTIEQYGSGIGCMSRHKRILKALGLRHPHHRVQRPDNPAVRGMVQAISHLARIVES